MYVNHERKLVYLAHGKAASQATSHALEKHCGFEQVGKGHHSGMPATNFERDDYEVATTVRYHLDALVSWWFHLHQKQPLGQPFIDELFRSPYFPKKREWWGLHRHQADVLLRFERLEVELNRWLGKHGLGPVELQPKGVTKRRYEIHYRIFIDWETVAYMDRRFGEEMIALGYPTAHEDMKLKVDMKGWQR